MSQEKTWSFGSIQGLGAAGIFTDDLPAVMHV